MFILVATFRESNPNWRLADRIGICLVNAMPSMAFTTVTDIAAFGLGAITATTPAIRVFCIYAVVAIFFDFLYQVREPIESSLYIIYFFFLFFFSC
jgi:hypothetical protein